MLKNQKGVIHLFALLALAVLVVSGFFILKNKISPYSFKNILNLNKNFDKVSATGNPTISQPIRIDKILDSSADNVYTYVMKTDNSGHLFIYWTENAAYPTEDRALFRVSSDYGKTFTSDPITIPTPANTQILSAGGILYPQMCNDNNGHVYLLREYKPNVWSTDPMKTYINISSDYGKTWLPQDITISRWNQAPTIIIANNTIFPQIACDENGHVYVVSSDERESFPHIYFTASSDYGKTWFNQDIQLDPGQDFESRTIGNSSYTNRQFKLPKISADNSGHVNITWQHAKFPTDDPLKYAKNSIYVASSQDFGSTWSGAEKLDHALDTTAIYSPAIYADNSGHVYISWLGRLQGSADYEVSLNKSQDFGQTWQSSDQKINSQTASLENTAAQGVYLTGDHSGNVYTAWREHAYMSEKPFFNVSSDYGVTWGSDMNVDNHTTANQSVRELSLSADKAGKVYSTFEIDRDMWFNYSSDNGKSWLPTSMQLDSSFEAAEGSEFATYGYPYQANPYLTNDENGHVYVAFVDQHFISSTSPNRTYLYLVTINPLQTPPPTSTPTPTTTAQPTPSASSTPAPLAINNVNVTNITSNSAVTNWTTSIPATSWVKYGSSPKNLNLSTSVDNNLVTQHKINLSGLKKNTQYYYQIYSQSGPTIQFSSTLNFKTTR